jgi:type III restriction enzyme
MSERRTTASYSISPVTLPAEPVIVPGDVGDAVNDPYVVHRPFRGWERNILPIARFDAKSTEWALAHLLDRDSDVSWWLRLDVFGNAYINTERDGRYFPDFVVIDTNGTHWLVEAKSDRNAQDADVLRKSDAAERWARAVTDAEEYGVWRYLLVTETNIKDALGSWSGLLIAASASSE